MQELFRFNEHGTWQEPDLFDQTSEPTRCPLCAAPFGDDVLSGDSWAYCDACGWVDHG